MDYIQFCIDVQKYFTKLAEMCIKYTFICKNNMQITFVCTYMEKYVSEKYAKLYVNTCNLKSMRFEVSFQSLAVQLKPNTH